MSGQLIVYILMFAIPATALFLFRYNSLPGNQKEEKIYSREFWMFVGSLILVSIALYISLDTSWPVINKLFGTNITITDPINHYNRYSIWFAILLMVGSGLVQFLKYKNNDVIKWLKQLIVPTVLAVILTILLALESGITNVLKGKVKVAGSAVAHIGFALIMVGILLSAGDKEVISLNTMNVDFGEAFDEKNRRQNVLLQKDMPINMDDYRITYKGDSVSGPNIYYKVNYQKLKDEKVTALFN